MTFQPKTTSQPTPLESPSPEPRPEATTTAAPDTSPSGPDFDAIAAAFPDPLPSADPASPGGGSSQSGQMTKDQFFTVFRAMFRAPNVGITLRGGHPFKAFEIDKGDDSAREASDVLYEICEDVPWLSWMIRPEGKWVQRAMVLGMFLQGRFEMLALEARERVAAARPADSATARPGGAAGPEPEGETSGFQADVVNIDGTNYDGVLQ